MNQQSVSPMLSKLAELFREEGDIETAAAIEEQLERAAARTLDEEDEDWLGRVLARAREFDLAGDYEGAVPSYAEALRTVEAALGASHAQAVDRLGDLARCQLNAGLYDEAMACYLRLLRLAGDLYGGDTALTRTVRYHIRFCERGIREVAGTLRLQAHIGDMLRQSQGQLRVAAAGRAHRMRMVALRLAARGRRAAAVRLHEAAIALRMQHVEPDDEAALIERHRHAMDLKEAGEPARAARVLVQLIAVRNRKSACVDQSQQLRQALVDAATCLSLATMQIRVYVTTRTRIELDAKVR